MPAMSRAMPEGDRDRPGCLGVEPLSESALLAWFTDAEAAVATAARLEADLGGLVEEVVPCYRCVSIHFDPGRIRPAELLDRLRRPRRNDGRHVPDAETNVIQSARAMREHEIPVIYDGPDLGDVSGSLGLTAAEVVRLHSGARYRVEAIGFRPGFPYLGGLPAPLAGLPRRRQPRTRVPSGAVAIVGEQSAIYPQASPGGWHLIGRTDRALADLGRGWFLLQVGDTIRFRPVDPGARGMTGPPGIPAPEPSEGPRP